MTGDIALTDRLVAQKLSVSRPRVWYFTRTASYQFPQPFRIGEGTRWSEREIDAWLEARKAERQSA